MGFDQRERRRMEGCGYVRTPHWRSVPRFGSGALQETLPEQKEPPVLVLTTALVVMVVAGCGLFGPPPLEQVDVEATNELYDDLAHVLALQADGRLPISEGHRQDVGAKPETALARYRAMTPDQRLSLMNEFCRMLPLTNDFYQPRCKLDNLPLLVQAASSEQERIRLAQVAKLIRRLEELHWPRASDSGDAEAGAPGAHRPR